MLDSSFLGYNSVKADIFALGSILFTMLFGLPPFTIASKENHFYRYFYRNNGHKFFLGNHPATKDLYKEGKIEPDMIELLKSLMDPNPDIRPKSVSDIRLSDVFKNHPSFQQSMTASTSSGSLNGSMMGKSGSSSSLNSARSNESKGD